MSIFEKIAAIAAARSIAENPPQEGDYTDENGILICGVCGEARRKKREMYGKEYLMGMACRCIRERKAEEERLAKQQEAERQKKIAFPLKKGIIASFSDDDDRDSKSSKAARAYADSFDPNKSGWLVLHGAVGRGKTFRAECIGNEVIDKGYSVMFTSVSEIERSAWDADVKGEIFRRLERVSLLILDDFGSERDTPYMLEGVYNIIDIRYRCRKPLVITTNLTAAEMFKCEDRERDRIYSRICEMADFVLVEGDERRRKMLARRIKE